MKKSLLQISLLAGGLAVLALGGGRQAGAADYQVQKFPNGIA